ncbi:MAG: MASE1 domain-containing protein [Luteibacter sp.]
MRALNKDPLAWGRYVAVAGAYAACYEVTRNFSFSHWMLPAGLRLACLLLVPRRFWPALAVGEFLPIAEMAALHASAFGTLWAILNSVPPILVCMPAVMWVQRRASLLRPDGNINMGMVLTATLLCSISVAIENTIAFVNLKMGDGSPPPEMDLQLFLSWLLGCYLGALALTPTIVAMRERLSRSRNEVDWRAILRSPLTRDSLYIAAPILAGLMVLSSELSGTSLQMVRVSMALPVIVLTFRHGWHGTAIAGLLASVALASTSFEMEDPSMIRAQVVVAFTISTSLLFGVRVARRIAASHALHLHQPNTGSHLR